ncbi:hypothetical protein QR680_011553 [Steinernema hermaphroditum]|uniref:Uncharacterized protein n=1 Tax=Steinernema hermaphroditum TaxID=289476 RepID=A0AA39LY96_9BILA|nr:hypothetical protein QR680_011553 [Steinernema hermaphroditum]
MFVVVRPRKSIHFRLWHRFARSHDPRILEHSNDFHFQPVSYTEFVRIYEKETRAMSGRQRTSRRAAATKAADPKPPRRQRTTSRSHTKQAELEMEDFEEEQQNQAPGPSNRGRRGASKKEPSAKAAKVPKRASKRQRFAAPPPALEPEVVQVELDVVEQPPAEEAAPEEVIDVVENGPEAGDEHLPPAADGDVQYWMEPADLEVERPEWWANEASFEEYKPMLQSKRSSVPEEEPEEEASDESRPPSSSMTAEEHRPTDIRGGPIVRPLVDGEVKVRKKVTTYPTYAELFDVMESGGHLVKIQDDMNHMLDNASWDKVISDFAQDYIRKHGLRNISAMEMEKDLYPQAFEVMQANTRRAMLMHTRKRIGEIIGEESGFNERIRQGYGL